MKDFIVKNYVFVMGLLSALVLVLQQTTASGETNWKSIGFAALIAVLGVIANQWKGKGITVTGIIGTVAYAFVQVYNTGQFTWQNFGVLSLLAVMTSLVEGLKSYAPKQE